jgi:hypothetical protein
VSETRVSSGTGQAAGAGEGTGIASFAAIQPRGISELNPEPPVEEKIKVWDALTRNGLAIGIMAAFLLTNIFTLGVLIWLGREDQFNLVRKLMPPTDRLVDKDVIIALLSASTVQLGSIAVIMAKYVFKDAG